MRWSKIFSLIVGSPESTVLSAKAEMEDKLGLRATVLSDESELNFVMDSIAYTLPAYIAYLADQYNITEKELVEKYPSAGTLIASLLLNYYIKEKNDKEFFQMLTRVLITYFGYDGTPETLNVSLEYFCQELYRRKGK